MKLKNLSCAAAAMLVGCGSLSNDITRITTDPKTGIVVKEETHQRATTFLGGKNIVQGIKAGQTAKSQSAGATGIDSDNPSANTIGLVNAIAAGVAAGMEAAAKGAVKP